MMAHACNPSIQEVETGESEIQGHPQLQCKFKAIQCYPGSDIQAGGTKNKEFQKQEHFYFTGVLAVVSTAMRRYHDKGNLKRKFS